MMVNTKFTAWFAKSRPLPLPFLAVVIGPLLLLGGGLVWGQALFWGTPSLQFVPWWLEAWNQISTGIIPLWNDLNGMGAPLAANYQSAMFYPPNWALFLFAAFGGAQGIAWGYTLLTVLHLIWGGAGMVVLLRRFGAGELAQAVGGLVFGLSGYTIGRLEFFSMVWVAAWLPWVIRYADEIASPIGRDDPLIKQRHGFPIRLVLALAAQLLAGHAQLSWYSIILTGLWVGVGAVRGGLSKIVRAAFSLTAAGFLAVGLAAVQILPTAEYLTQSQRSDEVDYDFAMTYSYWPWRFITLAAPDFFGNPGSGDYWGYASYWEDHAYIGVPALLLALSTVPWMLSRKKEKIAGWHDPWFVLVVWVIVLISFVLAMGQNTPIFPFLFRNIPTFDMFQAPSRYLIWATFGLSVLAGLGADRWRCPERKGLYWLRLGTAGMFAVALGAGIAWQTMGDVRLTFIRATALVGVWALGTGIFTLFLPRVEKDGRKNYWNLGVIAWMMADLLLAGWLLNPTTSTALYGKPTSEVVGLKNQLGDGRLYINDLTLNDLKFKRFFRFKDFQPVEEWRNIRATILPNINLLDGIASANNFDPLQPGRYVRWMQTLEILDEPTWRQWLRWMDVDFVEVIDIRQPGGVRFEPVEGGESLWWYDCVEVIADSDAGLATLKMGGGPDRLIVEKAVPGWDQGCEFGAAVRLQEDLKQPGKQVIAVNSERPGWLMISQTWYPGWKASVDGKQVDLIRAHYLFMAVPVPAGQHKVVVEYRPVSFVFGVLLSILIGVGLLARQFSQGKRILFRPRKKH